MISVVSAGTPALLKEFIHLPFKLYRNERQWIPPFITDEYKFHQPGQNPGLQECDSQLFLAIKDGKYVGRIMVMIHHSHNRQTGQNDARFFKLDCINNDEVCTALLDEAESWALSKGMSRIIGPFGLSDKDPQGVRVEGFEHMPVIAAPCQPAWLHTLIENRGYEKYFDCVSYRLDTNFLLTERVRTIARRAAAQKDIRILNFKNRSELKNWIVPVFRLINETYKNLFGFMPLSEEEMLVLAKQYLPVLDPAFTKLIVDSSDRPIAFVISMPNISRGIQKTRGRLLPFGFIHLLLEMKRSKQLDLLLGAVHEQWQNKGLTALLAMEIFREAHLRGMTHIDSHLILEENFKMRGVMDKFGGVLYKRFRVYAKNLS